MEVESGLYKEMDIHGTSCINNSKISPNVYHNTKLLLTLYNKVLWRINQSLDVVREDCLYSTQKHLDELISSLVDVDLYLSKTRFESRLQSIEESRSIINLIDKALIMLKSHPDNGERYYSLLYKVYISPYKYSEEEMLEYLCVSRSTYFREKKRAVRLLGTILWGFLIPKLAKELKQVYVLEY